MKLCLSCRRLSGNAAKYCHACGRSFGTRLCPKGHRSPATARFCSECGSTELSPPTLWLSLRPVTAALGFGLGLVCLRLVVRNFWSLAETGVSIFDSLLIFVSGTSLLGLLSDLCSLALITFIPFLLCWLFFEGGRLPSKSLSAYSSLLRNALRLSSRLALALGKAAFKRPKKESKTRRPARES